MKRAMLCLALLACKEDPKLLVTGIEPMKGDYMGGERLRVSGNRFTKDGPREVKVYFGTAQGQVTSFEDDETMWVRAPAGKPGEKVKVKFIFEPGGVFEYPREFSYVEQKNVTVDDLTTKK